MKKMYYENYDNQKLCGILTESNNSNKIVVMCHGIRGNKDECGAFVKLSDKLLDIGYSSFRFDFNGHGESEGLDKDMTITKEIRDVESTINMLKEKGYDEFVLLGGSFGAGIVSLFPYEKYDCIKAVVLWYGCLDYEYARFGNLFTDENKKIAEEKGYYTSKSMNSGEDFRFGLDLFNETYKYKPFEKIKECDLPKLFVHGDMDRALPYTLSEEVSNNCSNSTFKLIKGGEHTFMNSDDAINEAIKVTIDFINEVN